MPELGSPTSYLTLEQGVDVYDRAGERIGSVDHVLADPTVDVFDGLVVDTRALLGGHRFADADQIEALYERGVVLKCTREELHDPSANPPAVAATPDDTAESELHARLRRAWDWISGRY